MPPNAFLTPEEYRPAVPPEGGSRASLRPLKSARAHPSQRDFKFFSLKIYPLKVLATLSRDSYLGIVNGAGAEQLRLNQVLVKLVSQRD